MILGALSAIEFTLRITYHFSSFGLFDDFAGDLRLMSTAW